MYIKPIKSTNILILETSTSLILLSCAFFAAMVFHFELYINIISGKLYKYINIYGNYFIIYMFFITCFVLVLYHVFFSYFKIIFLTILFTSFSLSMVNISILSNYSFIFRNLSSVLLISVGLLTFNRMSKKFIFIEYLCIFYVLWCILNLFVNGINIESVLYLQFVLALTLGIIIGYKYWYFEYNNTELIGKAIALVGIFLTIFNLSALLITSQPFLGMRFRSFYNLPTSFANNYVIFYIAMIWFAMQDISLRNKLLVYSSLFVGIILIVISGTRNSLVSLLIGFLVLNYKYNNKKIIYVCSFMLLIFSLLLFLIYFDIMGISNYLFHYGEINTGNRNNVWMLAIKYALQNPFWGYGIGREIAILGKYQNEWEQHNSHNAFLGLWLQVGFIGAITILFIYVTAIYKGIILIKNKNKRDNNLVILAVSILLSLFVAGIAEDNLTSRGSIQQLMWGLSIGIICKYCNDFKIQCSKEIIL